LSSGGAADTATGQTSAIGELTQITTSQGKTVETPLGLYYVDLSASITEP
jgi:hypothetical protein